MISAGRKTGWDGSNTISATHVDAEHMRIAGEDNALHTILVPAWSELGLAIGLQELLMRLEALRPHLQAWEQSYSRWIWRSSETPKYPNVSEDKHLEQYTPRVSARNL